MNAFLKTSAPHDDPIEEFNLEELAIAGLRFGAGPVVALPTFKGVTRISMGCTCGVVVTQAIEQGHPQMSLRCVTVL
jgi:hypothetical protein